MSKAPRKRKSETKIDVEYKVLAPKNKTKLFNEKAQAEEEKLSEILFGGPSSFLKSLEEVEREIRPSNVDVDSGVGEDDSDSYEHVNRTPAWVDEDDGIEVGYALDVQGRRLPNGGFNSRKNKYSNLLKNKFVNVVGTPKWAEMGKKKAGGNSDSEDEILQSCGFVKKTGKAKLGATTIEFKKVKDLNCETYSEGPYINTVEFHPNSSVSMVAGNSGIATIYACDGKRNNKLHSVGFSKFPIYCGKFTVDGNEAILGSKVNFMYSYDLTVAKANRIPLPDGLTQSKNFVFSPNGKYIAIAGKWGEVHILLAASKERVFTLKQDGEVTALAFNPTGSMLFGHSDSGEVTIWDLNARRVRHKWTDDGCLRGNAISVSPSCQFVATGSAQGAVNIYRYEDVLSNKIPTPKKTVLNLTTGITDLKFNLSSEILALSSVDIENSVRLLHLGSMSVFNNFPVFGTKLGHVTTLNFSPGSGYFALGNKKSTVALYRLKHFKNY